MTTLREFEEALRADGNESALATLQVLKDRDKAKRRTAPARRVTGKKMTPELAHRILELHGATSMTQQEIAFKLGVNQGRVNEVIKRGKWLTDDPNAPEAVSRDRALERMAKARTTNRTTPKAASSSVASPLPNGSPPSEAILPAREEALESAYAATKARQSPVTARRPAARPPAPSGPPAQLSLGDF